MAKVYRSIEELVGKTPLLDAFRLRHEQGLYGRLLLKLEYLNPAGSCLLYTSPSPRD